MIIIPEFLSKLKYISFGILGSIRIVFWVSSISLCIAFYLWCQAFGVHLQIVTRLVNNKA